MQHRGPIAEVAALGRQVAPESLAKCGLK